MTAQDLAIILMREQDEDTDNTEMVDTVISWISDAVDEVASACEWRIFKVLYPFTLQPTIATYNLDPSVNDIRDIRFVDTDEPITYADEPTLFGIAANLEEPGKPRNWFFDDSVGNDPAGEVGEQPVLRIRFHPIPDVFYPIMISARKHPIIGPITSLDDIPLRQEMLLAVKDRVRAYILSNDKDYEGMNSYLQIFYQRVTKMIGDESTKPSARMLVMQPRDIANDETNKYARLDPAHYRN